MTSDQRKFESLAALCDSLAQNASTPEEREHLLDLANQWRAMATRPKIYQVPPRDAHAPRSPRGCAPPLGPILKRGAIVIGAMPSSKRGE